MLTEQLVQFGLSEKEAIVYLKLLELEVASAQEIAEATQIPRSTIYPTLEALKRRGLVNLAQIANGQRFVVSPPERLLEIAAARKRKYVSLQATIFDALSDLKSLYRDSYYKPEIEIYEGDDELQRTFEEVLQCKDDMYRICSDPERARSGMGSEAFSDFISKRDSLGLKVKGIQKFSKPHYLSRIEKKIFPPGFWLHDFVFIPGESFKLSSDLTIYDNTILFTSYPEKFCIKVTGVEVANTMKALFDMAFEEAKRIGISTRTPEGVRELLGD